MVVTLYKSTIDENYFIDPVKVDSIQVSIQKSALEQEYEVMRKEKKKLKKEQ